MSIVGVLISRFSMKAVSFYDYSYFAFVLLLICAILGFSGAQAYAVVDSPLVLGSIAGTVKNKNGIPLSGIKVSLHTIRNKYPLTQATTTTDIDGRYQATLLPTGDYHLRFYDPQGIYPTQYYTAFQWLHEASSVTVMSNDVRNIDMTLQSGGTITGLVTLEGEAAPLQSNTNIQFYAFKDDGWQKYDEVPLTSNLGIYRSSSLLPGVYRVCGLGSLPFTFLPLFHCFGGSSLNAAQNVTITHNAITSNVNVELLEDEVSGVISGTVMSAGLALPGIQVTLYKDYTEGILIPDVRTTTDDLGNYIIAGLQAGVYYARFTDPSGIFASQYYTVSPIPARSIPILLQAGKVISSINVSLTPAGAIHGTIFQADGIPLVNVHVRAWISQTVTGSFGQTVEEWSVVLSEAVTDTEGHYTIRDLLPALYRISVEHCMPDANQVTHCTWDYYSTETELYGNLAYIALPLADDVPVIAGATTNAIDITFGIENPIYLPMISR